MSINIPYDPSYFAKVPHYERKEIRNSVEAVLADFRANEAEIQAMAIECISNISNCESISAELANQGTLKRFWGMLSGKNQKLQDLVNESSARSLYAQQQILTCLLKQNASVLEFGAYLNHEQKRIELKFAGQLTQQMQYIRRICEQLQQVDQEFNRVMYRCPACNHGICRESVVCPRCGHIVYRENSYIKTDDARREYSSGLRSLSENVQRVKDAKRSSAPHYKKQIDMLLDSLNQMDLPDQISREASQLCLMTKKKIDSYRVEIAVVGTVKAGKSTLINALMGREIAVMDINPETSVLTKYQATISSGFLRVTFYNHEEWNSIYSQIQENSSYLEKYQTYQSDKEMARWVGRAPRFENRLSFEDLREKLHAFTAANTALHFFVKEVEVGVPGGALPRDVRIVDTPGLDDYVKIRSKVAEEYLHKADAIVACIRESEINRNAEVQFISRMLDYKRWDKLCLLATNKDNIYGPEAERLCAEFKDGILSKMMLPYEKNRYMNKSIFSTSRQRFVEVSALMYCAALAHEANAVFMPRKMDQYNWMLKQQGYYSRENILQYIDEIKNFSGIPALSEVLKDIFYAARKEKGAKKEKLYVDFVKQFNYLLKQHHHELEETLTLLSANEQQLLDIRSQVDGAAKRIAETKKVMAVLDERIGGDW